MIRNKRNLVALSSVRSTLTYVHRFFHRPHRVARRTKGLLVITADRKILITSITVRDPQSNGSNVTPSVNCADIKKATSTTKQQAEKVKNKRYHRRSVSTGTRACVRENRVRSDVVVVSAADGGRG